MDKEICWEVKRTSPDSAFAGWSAVAWEAPYDIGGRGWTAYGTTRDEALVELGKILFMQENEAPLSGSLDDLKLILESIR